jgi:predicted nucleotidyltransferase
MKPGECDKIPKMINPQSPVGIKRTQILQIAARNGVKRLRVFGSVARGTEDEQSDIDFLVELSPDRSLLDLGNFLYEVRSLLGKEVDVVTEKGLQHRIREQVLAEAVDL